MSEGGENIPSAFSLSSPETGPRYEKISPTAKFVAHLRTYDEIRYVDEIADHSNARAVFERLSEGDSTTAERFAPLFEARYKTINHMLAKYKIAQVLERASGLSPRGLDMSKDPNIRYVETDLSPIIHEKQHIIESILVHSSEQRANLAFGELNMTDREQFSHAASLLRPGPVAVVSEEGPGAVISEGVLLYLNREETEEAARNIRGLLADHGGVWITDVVTREDLRKFAQADPKTRRVIELVSGMTERSLESNPFRDEQEARDFFGAQGYSVETFSQAELVDQLTTIDHLGLNKERVRQQLASRKIWAMEPEIPEREVH